jgi:Ca2+-binding EF-hand superfamily protein
MASRETTILQDKVRELQNEKTDVTMDSLFSEIDRDGNGSISKEEFGRVFSVPRLRSRRA